MGDDFEGGSPTGSGGCGSLGLGTFWILLGPFSVRFVGRQHDLAATVVWENRAPLRCRFFAWLALKNRCWTSDRLARRGFPLQAVCPLCDQGDETIDHILVSCVFARCVWQEVLTAWGNPELTPTSTDLLLAWCTNHSTTPRRRKDFHTIKLLVLWTIWKHRNDIVFNNASPSMEVILRRIYDDGQAWHLAGLLRGEVSGLFSRLFKRVVRD